MEFEKRPKVTVLMPVRDGMPFLPSSIDSILRQTFEDFEFIIINDGSTDGTSEVLAQYATKDPRIHALTQPALGMRVALNRGLEMARGEYVARMDSDDIALLQRLEWQVAFLDQHPDVVVVGGQSWAIDEDDETLFAIDCPIDSSEIEEQMLGGRNCLSHPTTLYRRQEAMKHGGYLEEYPTDDYGLWLRLLDSGRLANLSEFVLCYRVHAHANSIRKHAQQRSATETILNAAHRRRGTEAPSLAVDHAPQSVARIHHHWAMSAIRDGKWRAARKHSLRSVKLEPWRLHGWWTLIKSLLKIQVSLRGQPS